MDCSATVSKIKSSVAIILVVDPNGNVVSQGTGFVYGKPGIIVTCNHVVNMEGAVALKFPGMEEFIEARIVLRDEEHDLALLKIDNTSIKYLGPAKESEIMEGCAVIFSGYPLGMNNLTTHQGILSSISTDATGITTYLIDGTVNPGNSGCPLMTVNGDVIGVVNAQRREGKNILDKVESMNSGALSIHSVDIVDIYKALMRNLQLGVGYAVPVRYIPDHKTTAIPENRKTLKVPDQQMKDVKAK